MLLVIIIVIVAILALIYAYAHKKTRWDIRACPFEVAEVEYLSDTVSFIDHGNRRRLDLLMTFDFGEFSENKCFVAREPKDRGKQTCYVFWREPMAQGYRYELEEGLRKSVQDAIVEAAATR